MSALKDLAVAYTGLTEEQIEHLHALVADWQLLADLAFSDLLLFAPVRERAAFVILAQVRPYPAQTLYQEDMVGVVVDARDRPRVVAAATERRIVREGEPEWREGTPIREEAIPVLHGDDVIGIVSAEQNLATARTPSQLELSYLQAAGDLAQMIAEGTFPLPGTDSENDISPRVGDGFLRLEADWTVRYASPNAVSAYRRIGVTANLVGEPLNATGVEDRGTFARLRRGEAVESEIESHGAYVLRRFVPIIHTGEHQGALVLVRDVTELRRRDRLLLLKDATIREIHHRVKNNLQTVAALLRLQARRLPSEQARAALMESVRRIRSIAIVHETLSLDAHQSVEFDVVADRILEMARESLAAPERPIAFAREGSAGDLPSEVATPLSLVLAEIIQNAVEHAFRTHGGTVMVTLRRRRGGLDLLVRDDGDGLPAGFAIERNANLGLQIVRTLVTTELGGTIDIASDGSGTSVRLEIPVDGVAQPQDA